MISMPGYRITQQIHAGEGTLVYRGKREADGMSAIIKIIREEHPLPQAIARFEHEYALLQSLHGEGTVNAYAIEEYQNGVALILEDFGTGSLSDLLATKKLSINEFLSLAMSITEALEKIHDHHIIHKDINPGNILWDANAQKIKIIDFGIASTLSKEMPEINTLQNFGEGTLQYMSPEQTGRMNRGIDYRTDYYSLGVTFYQMVTGMLPFQSEDIGELLHQHIAKLPPSPHEVNPSVPIALSAIIMKLLAKMAEDRYQSTFGIKTDLQNCAQQLQLKGKIDPFIIAVKDTSAQFQIPEKLYGREEERSRFINEFKQASTGRAKLIFVAGYAGVGKSTLVHEIYKPLVEDRGYFISGKFDQFKRNIPYSVLIQAIQEFIQQILLENDKEINLWRERLQKAIGANGQVIVDVVPMLSAIIGTQAPAPVLEPVEAQNRFKQVFIKFIQALTSPGHSLVIFLDDCQWADVSTLKLLEALLLDNNTQHLLIVGAYRDNEINKDHVLTTSLGNLQKADFSFETLMLKPLALKHVKQLIADALHYDEDTIQSLAEVCYQKTEGNPFFLNQFLQELYKERLLKFDLDRGNWNWDIHLIQTKEVSKNVVDFMAKRLEKLSKAAQAILKVAACIGNHFDLVTLEKIIEKTPKQITDDMWDAVKEGLIVPVNEDYQFVTDEKNSNASYRFLHGRVQQAAYTLIPVADRNALHLKIGRMLLKNTESDINETVQEIVNQIDYGMDLLTDPEEKIAIAKLNLIAAKKAKASIAYSVALNYLKNGIALLDKKCWNNQYDLALSLYTEATEIAYLAAETDAMEKYSRIVIKKAKKLLDKIKVYEIKINYLADQNKLKESQELGLYVLGLLGIKLPANPSARHILFGLASVKWRLLGKKIPDLYHLKEMTDQRALVTIRVLEALAYTAHMGNTKLFLLITLETIKLSIKYGNTVQSAFSYVCYGSALCNALNDVKNGYQFGQLAMRLASKFKANEAKVQLVFYTNISYFRQPVNDVDLVNAFQKGIETNEIAMACYCAAAYITQLLVMGRDLSMVLREINKYLEFMSKSGQILSYVYTSGFLQLVSHLIGSSNQAGSLSAPEFDEDKYLAELHVRNDLPGLRTFYGNKLLIGYMFGDYKSAYDNLIAYNKFRGMSGGSMFVKEQELFYGSLTCLAYYYEVPKKEQKKLLKIVKHNQKKLKALANDEPANFINKYYLCEAELARILGDDEKAAVCYDKSIKLSKEHHFIHAEALANELAARFYLEKGKDKIAALYINDAHYYYMKWGAFGKVKQIEEQYQHIFMADKKFIPIRNLITTTTTSTTKRRMTETLDLTTVFKAASAISREIELSSLLKTLMHIVIENAGAQKGYLLLEKSGRWYVEAQSDIDSEDVTVLQSLNIENTLPASIIKYVIRTHQPVVLDDAMHGNQYTSDPYIQSAQPKSILCVPLLNQGVLSAILYLENKLTTDAFTPERLELLNLLSSVIVVSIDNARLYTDMRELNQNMIKLNEAYDRFVPHQFLNLLEKQNITDVEIGDQVEKELAVMFCDIRGFTTLSEKMTAAQSMEFINTFLSYMTPIISRYQGFIDKYIGDAIMALYPTNADDALRCAIEMLNTLYKYNHQRVIARQAPIHVGIGINSGMLVLGTVGAEKRMEGTVISDVVNVASRLEGLTKVYSTPILITEEIYTKLRNPALYSVRKLDTVLLKGKSKPITIYEVFDNDAESLKVFKRQCLTEFEEGVILFQQKQIGAAVKIFEHLAAMNRDDLPIAFYVKRCQKILSKKASSNIQNV